MNEFAQKTQADYLLKQKGPDGKYTVVGRGWKKEGQYGPFISLSIGPADQRQSYLMVKAEKRPVQAVRTGPPKQMPEKLTYPTPAINDFDDL